MTCAGVLGAAPLGEGGVVKTAGLNPGGRLSPSLLIAKS